METLTIIFCPKCRAMLEPNENEDGKAWYCENCNEEFDDA